MNNVITPAISVIGAAGIVATLAQGSLWVFDRIKDPVTSNRVKRIFVFLLAFAVIALDTFHRVGYHANGDVLSLAVLAGTVGATAITGWSLFNGKLDTQPAIKAVGINVVPYRSDASLTGDPVSRNGAHAPVTPVPPTPTPQDPGPIS